MTLMKCPQLTSAQFALIKSSHGQHTLCTLLPFPAHIMDSRLRPLILWLGKPARRETNTMPHWAGSCWYYLRFMDPKNSEALVDKMKEMYWSPADVYVGGAEHAVLHLLYSRFWHKVLCDIGAVSTKRTFQMCHKPGVMLEEASKVSWSQSSVDVFGEHHQERIPNEKTLFAYMRCSWAYLVVLKAFIDFWGEFGD
ncbi:hypothetical protein LOK49_Contig1G00011 [Camellia lanceoleosa]|nr:hypothetical protein LOK49_Contig1G00011 [Camellia lanceoleosa]